MVPTGKAKLFVVSDLPLDDVRQELEKRFGNWRVPGAAGAKSFRGSSNTNPRIVLVDRKDSPQSVILAAQLLPIDPRQEIVDLQAANEVIGGGFLSRINMDLRETKGWSYGVGAGVGRLEHAVAYQLRAPVQADRTGESIAALIQSYRDFLSTKGVTSAELERVVNDNVRSLPGSFETNGSVMQAIQTNDMFGRPDDYYEQLPAKYLGLSQQQLDRAVRKVVDPTKFLWVVVGDAAKVKPQLEKLGLPIEEVSAN